MADTITKIDKDNILVVSQIERTMRYSKEMLLNQKKRLEEQLLKIEGLLNNFKESI